MRFGVVMMIAVSDCGTIRAESGTVPGNPAGSGARLPQPDACRVRPIISRCLVFVRERRAVPQVEMAGGIGEVNIETDDALHRRNLAFVERIARFFGKIEVRLS